MIYHATEVSTVFKGDG